MHVIGTAGHVDHGKSTLIAALSGINPDRLKEEQERQMTIDLGFAWFDLPDGEMVGVIDVPGHRDFIENMLAGVGGIDAVLFVVASDEGVMPQTREHLAILDILQIQAGIIVMTKVDLNNDPAWLELVSEDIRHAVAGTILENAPIVPVSARTGYGLDDLRHNLVEVLAQKPSRSDLGRPRLPIDRVFTIAGFGTVVTGTLSDGVFHLGEEVEILPSGLHGRIRGLQTHKQKEEAASPGSRTAINISGVAVDQVKRGEVITLLGSYQPTSRLDVRFRLLRDSSGTLKHDQEVKLFCGAAESLGRVRLLGQNELRPGDEGWLQIELTEPVVAVRGDRYILRRPSPGETLGGGMIVDPQPRSRHKRFSADVLTYLDTIAKGSPEDILLQAVQGFDVGSIGEILEKAHLGEDQGKPLLQEMMDKGKVVGLEENSLVQRDHLVISKERWLSLTNRAVAEVQAYLVLNPLRRGIPKEQLKNRLKLAKGFNAVLMKLEVENRLKGIGPLVALPGHEVHFNPRQKAQVEQLLDQFARNPYSPPSIKECQAEVGEELFNAVVEMGRLVPVSSEVVFREEDYRFLLEEIKHMIEKAGSITVAQFRDRFNTSRRYALAFLEHLDQTGITLREGDFRRLRH